MFVQGSASNVFMRRERTQERLAGAQSQQVQGQAVGRLECDMAFSIRPARLDDATRACQVVRRSIAELCVDDHRNDPATLYAWLANKIPSNFERWMVPDHHIMLVAAADDGSLVGVGLLSRQGVVALLYVAPEARFRGVSRALLSALEGEARAAGIGELRLESTRTARQFYLGAGYEERDEPSAGIGVTVHYPMAKQL